LLFTQYVPKHLTEGRLPEFVGSYFLTIYRMHIRWFWVVTHFTSFIKAHLLVASTCVIKDRNRLGAFCFWRHIHCHSSL